MYKPTNTPVPNQFERWLVCPYGNGDPAIDWEKLKADLEGLHMDHLKQVLRLVELMMTVKEEDEQLLNSHRSQ